MIVFICTQIFYPFIFQMFPLIYLFNDFILGLMKMKEDRQDLNEVEEKHQDQKDCDVNGEKSVSCSIQKTDVKKPFRCSQCGNTYRQKRSLMKHMRIHSEE